MRQIIHLHVVAAVLLTYLIGCEHSETPMPDVDESHPHYILKLQEEGLVPAYKNAQWFHYVLNRDIRLVDSVGRVVSFLSLPIVLKQYSIDADTISFTFMRDDSTHSFAFQDTAAYLNWGMLICKNCSLPNYLTGAHINSCMGMAFPYDNNGEGNFLRRKEAEMLKIITYMHFTNQQVNPWLLNQAKLRYRSNGYFMRLIRQ